MDVRLDVERLDHSTALDAPVDALHRAAHTVLANRRLRDVLHGTWMGHALHPAATDVPIGCWTSALLLDLVVGRDGSRAAQFLIGAGVAAAVPTAASGLADWMAADQKVKRTGVVHAGANTVALVLYGASWLARRKGRWGRGVALGAAGGAVASASAWLGAHLSYGLASGVNREAHLEPPLDWVAAASMDAIPEGKPTRVDADGFPVLVFRENGALHAIGAVCSHLSGPLDEGEVHDGCVTCPWHGSTFRLDNGGVVHGPAQVPQYRFETRLRDGQVELRLRR